MKRIKINYVCKMLAFIFQNATYHNISVSSKRKLHKKKYELH